MNNEEVNAEFESLKKDLGYIMEYKDLVKHYHSIFFFKEYATNTKQTEYLLRVVLSNRTIMQNIVETIENFHEFKENPSEDVSDTIPDKK